ncbi:MAG: F0F1 ATP synthase subunit B [Clostridiales bacterium]
MLAMFNLAFIALIEAEEHKGGLLDVNPGLIFWTGITFLILLFILKKVAWKPIIGALDERENFIKDSMQRAEVAKNEAERLLEENKANLARAEEEAQKVIAQGREFAEKLKAQILSESKAEAQKMIENASAEIKRKNVEAFESLKAEVAMIAVQAAEKILRENLDKEKQNNLVNKFIDELPKN